MSEEHKRLLNSLLFKPVKYKIVNENSKRLLIVGIMKTNRDYYYVKIFSFFKKEGKWSREEISLNNLEE